MKRIISIALIICSLKCISLYAQTIGMYSTALIIHEAGPDEKANTEEYKVRDIEENTPIPYNVPLEEIAEKIEHVYAYDNTVYFKTGAWWSAEYLYGELGALPEGEDVLISVYAVKGNRLLFLPEDKANTEILLNDMPCKLYYSEKEEGYLFYALIDWQLVDDGVPVNYYEGYYDYGIKSCIVGVKEVPEPQVIDYYYQTDYQYEINDLVKLGEVRVSFNPNVAIELPEIPIDGNAYIDAVLEYMADVLRKEQQFGSYEVYLETYGRLHGKYGEGTYCQISGVITGNGLEEYFFFDITDGWGYIDKECVFPTFYSGPVDDSIYFVNHGHMANKPENLVQRIIGLQRETVHLEVTKEAGEETKATKSVIPDYNSDIDFRTMSAGEAEEWINYVYNYGECFGMNELGYQEGELRKYCGDDILMYTRNNTGDTIYFIPKSMTNTTIIGGNGQEYRVYVNKDGNVKFYCLERNRYADKDGQLRTKLFTECYLSTEAVKDSILIGEGKLQLLELSLLDVPEVAEDEYVTATKKYVEDILKQNEKSGRYEMYIGEYEALFMNEVCLSVALLNEEDAYYFRYMIVKNGEDYYFWPVGFGFDGSLEECAGDRHYMNSVCIDRTMQLGRTEIVLDIEPSASLLKLEEMLENNFFEIVTFQNSEKAIAFYETNVYTPFDGYQIPVYRETSEKDILFEGTFLVEKDTGDIYIRGEKNWVLLKEGILKDLNLPDEPEDVFMHEYDGDNEVVAELLDKVFDFLKTKKEYANFKIKYDGAYSFLGRKYHSFSLIEDINDDMIHTLQRYSVDMETGDLYQESDPEERKELYYMGNLGIEQETAEAGTEDIEYVDKVIPVQYTNDLSYLADMKYTNSTYAYQDGKVYYRRYHKDSYEEAALWGEYDAILETKKEMVCVDAKGIETVLFTDEGYGDIYLLNNRFYLTTAERKESAYGHTYTARCLYSVNMQGKERIDYGEGYVFAIDKEKKIIIMQLREESGICYYAVNYESGKKERLCFEYPFDSGAYQDGWFYYERHNGDDVTCKLCAVSLEGEEREIIVLTSDDNQVPNVREHISDIKVDENRIYFIFGGCDGSLQVFQGGKLISVKLDGTDYKEVETENDVFYLSHNKGKPLVYFVSHYNALLNENDTVVWDVEENICYRSDFPADTLNYYEKSIYKDGSIYKNVERMWRYYPATMGSLYSVMRYDSELRKQKEDIYAIPDDSGRIVRVVTDIEKYITKWEEEEASYIDYEDFYFADGYLYFKVEYSVYDEGTSIGWRDGLCRLHVDIYRLKIGESKAEVLYSY